MRSTLVLFFSFLVSFQSFAQEYSFKKHELHDFVSFYDIYKIPSSLINGSIIHPDINSLSLLIAKGKSLSITLFSKKDFGNVSIPMSKIPELLITEDFDSIQDNKLKKDLKKLSMLGDINIIKKGSIFNKFSKAYVFHGKSHSIIWLYSHAKPEHLTQIVAHGFKEKEFNLLLSGLPDKHIKLRN